MMMLVFAMPLMTACGSDDNENNGSSYTSDEIVELLTGKWEIAGDIMVTEIETGKRLGGTYTGNIEFKDKKKISRSIKANTEIEELKFNKSYPLHDIIYYTILSDHNPYTILKKDGKSFIAFNKDYVYYNFEIESLTKNTFKMKLNDDLKIDGKSYHITMTMVSK